MRRSYKTWIIVSACLMVVAIVWLWFSLSQGFEAFQHDADIIRLQHLNYFGNLIEEYHDKTGKYPLQGRAEVPLYVHVANDHQIKFTKNGPPDKHEVVPFAEFIAEVENGLGRPIDEYYDPQLQPVHRPNFYIYLVHKDFYFFAVHVDQDMPFAKRIGDHYYKVEISNVANDQNKANSPLRLFGDSSFLAAIQTKILKPGFFKQRETYYLHFTKR